MVPLVAVLLSAALGPASAHAQATPPAPINLTVYYEALCRDSVHFVLHQLWPLWQRIGDSDALSLTFVPWGKAWEHTDAHGPYITCQHGPEECWGNRLHGCVLSRLDEGIQQLKAVRCLLENHRQLRVTAPDCVRHLGLDWEEVSSCATSNASLTEALAFGRLTAELQPALTFVPTMAADGSQGGQPLMLSYLEYFICETWRMRTSQIAPGCPAAF